MSSEYFIWIVHVPICRWEISWNFQDFLSIFRALKHFRELPGIGLTLKVLSEHNKENYSYPFGPTTKVLLCALNFSCVYLPKTHLASAQAPISIGPTLEVSKCSSVYSFQFGSSPGAQPGLHRPGREPTRGPSGLEATAHPEHYGMAAAAVLGVRATPQPPARPI
jgi:hypothetical protein